MYLLHGGTPAGPRGSRRAALQLPDAEPTEPDDVGVFEIHLNADDKEQALSRIWDAVALSGTGRSHRLP